MNLTRDESVKALEYLEIIANELRELSDQSNKIKLVLEDIARK